MNLPFIFELKILGSLGLAMLLGALIGYEREMADKPAGFRTHMLVAGAAALLVALGDVLVKRFGDDSTGDLIRADPIRIIEAIITGVSFLGAGTIIRNGRQRTVEGITTAASLLLTAGLGICVALHEFVLAVGVTLLTLIILRAVRAVEGRLAVKKQPNGRQEES